MQEDPASGGVLERFQQEGVGIAISGHVGDLVKGGDLLR